MGLGCQKGEFLFFATLIKTENKFEEKTHVLIIKIHQ